MKSVELSLATLGLIAGTRGMLGAGVGLLVAEKMPAERRRAVGWTLAIIGAVTTLPLLAQVYQSGSRRADSAECDSSR